MAKASSFDWSQLDRQTLFDVAYQMRDRLVGQSLPVKKFHDTVIRHLKSYFPIKAAKTFDIKVEKTWVYVGGCYYSDLDAEREHSIEINLAYNPKDKNITITARRFSRLCVSIADTLLHEIIHMRQFRKRKFKALPGYQSTASRAKQRLEQEYLGDNDEIDAYSFNIACELNEKFNSSQRKIVNYLNEDQKNLRRRHNSWRMYLQAFGHNHRHDVIQRVKKRVIYYLPKATAGKPFRSCDWIGR
jgi:hypothetical protein